MANENDRLTEILEKGETVRWNGSAQAYGIFDEAHKRSTFTSIAWGLAVGILLTGGYLWLCASRDMEVKNAIIVFALGLALLILWNPVSNQKHLARMKYAITDKRVIAFPIGVGKAFAMPLSAIDAVRIVPAGPGTCHILFGASIAKATRKKLLALTLHGKDADGEGKVKISKGMVFYNISVEAGDPLRASLRPLTVVQEAVA